MGCSDDTPCPIHEGWGKAREILLATLKGTTMEELKKPELRKMINGKLGFVKKYLQRDG